MRFTKMHGAGNDYVYVDARGKDEDWEALAAAISDRHTGIGSDGLILAGESAHADVRMTMFNADGSEGQMCGNGVRCLVSFAVEQGIAPCDRSPIVVETASGDKVVTPVWENGVMVRARVDMGAPNVATEDVPVDAPGFAMLMDYPLEIDGETIPISCVSMGNPHAVAFIRTPVADYPLHEIGPKVEHHPMFPERVNFEIVNVIDQGHVRARVWERGSGLTEACGTGACAVVAIGRLQRKTRGDVTVSLPGGDLHIDWPGEGGVMMEGPIAKVFEGNWPS
jgi:diaminopimelate epimerase